MDMSQYLDMFIDESQENIENLNNSILELEKNPDDKEMVNTIFRAAHTLKGMAGSMGFNDMMTLTHTMENVLDKFRNGELKVTSDVITVLFKCLDMLTKMLDNIKQGNNETVDTAGIEKELNSIAAGNAPAAEKNETTDTKKVEDNKNNAVDSGNFQLNEYDFNIIKEARGKGYKIYKVYISLYKDCILKSARAFLVYKTLEESGEIVKSVPSAEDLEQEKFGNDFTLLFITQKNADDIKKIIDGISEIDKVEITEETNVENLKQKEAAKPAPTKENKVAAPVNNGKKGDEKSNKKIHQYVRVDLDRMDKCMNLVEELVIHRTRLEQLSTAYKLNDLHETLEQVGRITSDLQDIVMRVRMLPVEKVFNRFPRIVRDLSQELHKDMDLIIEGEDTELDRSVIDEIGEPLMHLIRNSADHGIESSEERIKQGKPAKGIIKLSAYQEGNKAIIKEEDDGKGLNVEKIKQKAIQKGIDITGMSKKDIMNLIFMQGFSTNDKVTDISGRGVGMDVVKTKIAAIGGTVDFTSEEGKGTTFKIMLPLTLSIIQALLVKIADETFAISLGFIDKVINIADTKIKLTNNREVIVYRDEIVPLVRLSQRLNITPSDNKNKYVVIIKTGEITYGLLVDSLAGQQEIVIKTLGKSLRNIKEYVGATILGNGLVTLILDAAALM